jgi:hypothetical protein
MNQMFITVNMFSYDTLVFLVGGWVMGMTPQTQYIMRITVLGDEMPCTLVAGHQVWRNLLSPTLDNLLLEKQVNLQQATWNHILKDSILVTTAVMVTTTAAAAATTTTTTLSLFQLTCYQHQTNS